MLVGHLLAVATTASLFAQEPNKVDDGLTISASDWPWWRGPNRDGSATPNDRLPIEWGSDTNLDWKVPIAGRGYGSMCLFRDSIYLVSSDETIGSQFLICLDRETGKQKWVTTIHERGGMRKNEKSTAASCTPACDGTRIYVSFPNEGRLMSTAVDLQGKLIWQTKICDYVEHQGYGASPALYQSLVIIAADNKAGGAIAGLNRETGKVVWSRERPKVPNYPSPILLHLFGKDQLIMTG